MKMIRGAVTASALALAVVAALAQGGPAAATEAAPARVDRSSCTHHWSGPQICIRMTGDALRTRVVGFWSNPPGSVRSRTTWLASDGRRITSVARATRVGKTVSFTWSGADYRGRKICVRFRGINRTACQDAPV
ncbi:hypothetical protein [Streptomyces sp. NPDC088785]|uniref:hypothetical protein n=1 Tax=Streptomyces sp. NPDC088785 TaxID=3365897 RepID=UPI0038275DA2